MAKAKQAPHKPSSAKPSAVNIFAMPDGGFMVRDPFFKQSYGDGHGHIADAPGNAAFSTLEEALEWLGQNMARPATQSAKAAA
jgi:hypothetical protein